MDFSLFLNFNVPNSRQPLFSSLYTNDSKKKVIFIGIFLHCSMPNERKRKGDSFSDNHLIQRKMRFTKLTYLTDPRDLLHLATLAIGT